MSERMNSRDSSQGEKFVYDEASQSYVTEFSRGDTVYKVMPSGSCSEPAEPASLLGELLPQLHSQGRFLELDIVEGELVGRVTDVDRLHRD